MFTAFIVLPAVFLVAITALQYVARYYLAKEDESFDDELQVELPPATAKQLSEIVAFTGETRAAWTRRMVHEQAATIAKKTDAAGTPGASRAI